MKYSKQRGTSSLSSNKCQIKSLITHGLVGFCCFYFGLLTNMTKANNAAAAVDCPACPVCPTCSSCDKQQPQQQQEQPADAAVSTSTDSNSFPESLKNFAHKYGTIPREDLNQLLEIGVPLDEMNPSKDPVDALIVYPSENTMPRFARHLQKMNATHATENCMSVKVILQDAKPQKKQCLVILPQWESYHVHKFMRLPIEDRKPESKELPLRYVSTSHAEKGQYNGVPSMSAHTMPFYTSLIEYLQNMDRVTKELSTLLKKLNSKTIIVLVCNHGQSELLHNFVCNAKAKGLDLGQVFLFATDEKTLELATSLGIPAYYEDTIFAEMPEQAANGYGDRIFAKMMLAKVYCVHLVLHCGYNVLFQDVDVVWYQNPLSYLEGPELNEWDMMFQDDGARSNRYAPYSPNTGMYISRFAVNFPCSTIYPSHTNFSISLLGFYYVRYNEKTLYFFNMLLRHGDYIAKVKSHQAGLVAVMNEHVMWKGLRVKTFPRGPDTKFPGGAEYHRYKDAMKGWITGSKPVIFHMSWTTNKKNKKLYFEQMGEWYTNDDDCDGLKCCLVEPKVKCHYRDKPSSVYCGMVDPIDKNRPSFWTSQDEVDKLKKNNA